MKSRGQFPLADKETVKMKTRQITTLALIALLAIALGGVTACGNKASTPTEGIKAFWDAAKKKDAAAMKQTISKRMLAELEAEAKRENKPFDEFLVNINLPDLETRDEKIEGDNATVDVKTRSGSWKKTKLVKEDGTWKLDSD
jgi:hypothetical protein